MADIGDPLSLDSSLEKPGRTLPVWLRGGLGVIAAILATMWFIEGLDSLVLDDRLEGNGIRPRNVDGIDGILWSPFLHSGFPHLISNSIPFVVLSGLTLTGGLNRYLKASAIIILAGGLLVWGLAIGSNENHIGASGWVFGLLGFLLAAAIFDRNAVTIAVGLFALMFYGGTLLTGFIPRDMVSWEGHLFGFIAGVLTARLLSTRRPIGALDSADAG